MTLIIAFIVTSFLASILVVAALMLSSRLSQQEGVQERYEREVKARERRV